MGDSSIILILSVKIMALKSSDYTVLCLSHVLDATSCACN